jgi:heme-degrading monooxygenase HmoA
MVQAPSGPPTPIPNVILRGFYVYPDAGAQVKQFMAILADERVSHNMTNPEAVAIYIIGRNTNILMTYREYLSNVVPLIDTGNGVLELDNGIIEGTWWTTREGAQAWARAQTQAHAQAQGGGRRRKSIHKKRKSSHKKKSHRRRRH